MQRIFNPNCHPKEYQQQGKLFPFPDLSKELCPQCHADILRQHGFYSRWLTVLDFSGLIIIRRFLCKACGKTVSLLPSFAHPRRGHGIVFIIGILNRFYLTRKSATQAIEDFQNNTGVNCSRQLFKHFRKRFEDNLNRLLMEIIALHKLKSPPVTVPTQIKRQRARQFLEYIQSFDPEDVSLKLFERSRTTYLTALAN